MMCMRFVFSAFVLLVGMWFAPLVSAQSVTDLATSEVEDGRQALFTPSGLSIYKLSAGDVISIRVLGEDDLNREKIRLTDAGSISYPALGEIKVLNMTVGDLEKKITDGLRGRILVNPKVSVQIDEYRPYYINGMVEKVGSYPFQPGLTVRKAISVAGGFKERASVNKIFIIRDNDPAQRSQKASLNSPVYPGDILTVEESFF